MGEPADKKFVVDKPLSVLPQFCFSGFTDGFGRKHCARDCCWALREFLQKRKKRIKQIGTQQKLIWEIESWIKTVESLHVYDNNFEEPKKSSVEQVVHVEAAHVNQLKKFVHVGFNKGADSTSLSFKEAKEKVRTLFGVEFPDWVYLGFVIGTRHSEAAEALRGWLIGCEANDRYIDAINYVLKRKFSFSDPSEADASDEVFDKIRAMSRNEEGGREDYRFLNSVHQ